LLLFVNTVLDQPLTIHGFPRAILHIDGDAFFASCEQARDPKLKGKPVVTGKERGICASMSYEAKEKGVKRGMPLWQIKKVCTDVILLPSDYETYSLLSKRFFAIVRRYTPHVEEYSIDECFADLTGLRRPLRMSYEQMAGKIKNDLDTELGFTFSIGLAPNKVLAKVGSKWNKPSGITIIAGYDAHKYLAHLALDKIWGIGSQTKAYLEKNSMYTALDFARKDEFWVLKHLTKPHVAIWNELRGEHIFALDMAEKQTYYSIQKVKTFTPPSNKKEFLFAQLSKNIENACIKLRRYNLAANEVVFFLNRQDFSHQGVRVKFSRATCIPADIVKIADEHFADIYSPRALYRTTGVVLFSLESNQIRQPDLFGEAAQTKEALKLYSVIDLINKKYGKHKVYLASSMNAHSFGLHQGERGDEPQRKTDLFRGETKRKRLAIPTFLGEVA
jgi:nucleotidyltransferase/DNA polymerase involved in DNA repair